MHRRKLLELIQGYSERFPDEVECTSRFATFVSRYTECFQNDCWAGHVTGSAWVVDPAASSVLLTHHRKLDRWLQLGGHSDGDPDPVAVATREAIEEGGPYGHGWSQPRIVTGPVRLIKADVVGTSHVRLIAGGDDGKSFKAIAFRAVDSAMGQALLSAGPSRRFWLAGRVKRDDWSGRGAAEMHLDDAAFAE